MSPLPPVKDPIDAIFRQYLRSLEPNQKELAKRLGRSQGWLNKYLNGKGKATIDEVIRLAAIVVLGVVDSPPLTAEQRRLLRDWETLPPAAKNYLKATLAAWRGRRREPRSKSGARTEQTNHATAGKLPGTR